MKHTLTNSTGLSKKSAARLLSCMTAVAMAIIVPGGMVGCATNKNHHQMLKVTSKRSLTDGKIVCTGSFNEPAHASTKNVLSPIGLKVPVTVSWAINGCTFGGGKVSIYLLQNGVKNYCGTLTLGATSASQVGPVNVTMTPVTNPPVTGMHDVKCLITGKRSDNVEMDLWNHSDYNVTAHCQ